MPGTASARLLGEASLSLAIASEAWHSPQNTLLLSSHCCSHQWARCLELCRRRQHRLRACLDADTVKRLAHPCDVSSLLSDPAAALHT